MGCLGLEPRTIRLKAEYSTIELATHTVILTQICKNVKVFKKKFENSKNFNHIFSSNPI